MTRFIVYDRFGAFVKELAPEDVFSAVRTAQVNGEDGLEVSTSDYLVKGQRVVWRDGMGLWHEHIVAGGDEAHDTGRSAVGTYYCENSWAELRTAPLIIDKRPGSQVASTAEAALETALDGTRWEVGECDVTRLAKTSWYHVSPWAAVTNLVEVWGGQLRADIEVDGQGVVSRKLSLLQNMGLGPGVRFDYGADVTGISVTYDESDVYTALYCYGKGVQTESGGYGRKIGIEDVNGGVPYVEDAEAKQIWGQLGPDGLDNAYGVFEDGQCEDPATLKAEGVAALESASRPKAQYSASVVQFARAGLDARGVTLGDRADVVDRKFYRSRGVDSDLRVTGSVAAIKEDLIDPNSTEVTLGDVMGGIDGVLSSLADGMSKVEASMPTWNDASTNSTAYVNDLIDRLNQEINATGGYTYIKPGQGIWVYDKAEDQNPTKVINLMGGSMRIADSKTASGDWDWRSVFVSGHIASDLVTAVEVTAGFIGSPDGENYWNLDTGELRMTGAKVTVDGNPVATANDTISSVDVEYASGTSSTTPPTSGWSTDAPAWQAGRYIWQRTKTTMQDGTVGYSDPTCIQGAAGEDGSQGEDGRGVSAIVEQYYLSTSSTTPTGGSWSTAQPSWSKGRYIWTRSAVTWTDGSTAYTDPVLAKAINGANEAVDDLDSSLDQQGVFDRLTNNGEDQGIYLQDGKVYINGEYIRAGTVSTDRIKSTSQPSNMLMIGEDAGRATQLSLKCSEGDLLDIVRTNYASVGDNANGVGLFTFDKFFCGGNAASGIARLVAPVSGDITNENGVVAREGVVNVYGGDAVVHVSDDDVFMRTSMNGSIVSLTGTAAKVASSSGGAEMQVSDSTTGTRLTSSTNSALYLNNNSFRLQGAGSYNGLNVSSSVIYLYLDSTHYLKLSASEAYFRLGSVGFGWYNGQFNERLTWS